MKICPICKKTFENNINICPVDNEILDEDLTALIGKTLDGQYHIEKLLGQGGMGAVFRARHTLLGDQVAIKVMPSSISKNADYQRRFLREGKTARQFSHPNVVAVHDLRTTNDGMLYMVLEYVDGHTLTDELRQRRRFYPKEAVEILEPIGEALTMAHSLKIVHRDLKPDNIMVGKAKDGSKVVKLLDLGIAKVQNVDSTALTVTGQILGTPHYMSPEQWNGDQIDSRADIYSLGIILYELIAGTRPFQGKTIQNLAYHHSVTMPPLLCEVVSNVSQEFSKAVQRAIEKDPENRPTNCQELFRELKEALKFEVAIEEDLIQASTLVINEPIDTKGFVGTTENSENKGTLISKTSIDIADATVTTEKKQEAQSTLVGLTETTSANNKNSNREESVDIATDKTADINVTLKNNKSKPTQDIHSKTLVEEPNKTPSNTAVAEKPTNNETKPSTSEKRNEDPLKTFVDKEKASKEDKTKSFFSEDTKNNQATVSGNTPKSSIPMVLGATGLLAVLLIVGMFIWKNKETQTLNTPTPTRTSPLATTSPTASSQEEVLNYWLEFFPPVSKDEKVVVSINEANIKTIPSNYGFKFHFSAKRTGYLYIIGLGESDLLTSFLTNNPDTSLGVQTNKIQVGEILSLPNGTDEKGIDKAFSVGGKPGKEVYTVIFSNNPLITLSFLNAKPRTFLGKTAIGEFEQFRAFAQIAKVDFQAGKDQVKSLGKVFVPKTDDEKPIIFDISFEHN
jgi:serine/threonine-protein kinase